jgi:hypothetical protein
MIAVIPRAISSSPSWYVVSHKKSGFGPPPRLHAKMRRFLQKGVALPLRESMDARRSKRRQQWQSLLFWSLFAAGLLVQLLAQHLEISNGAFVVPPALSADGESVRLDEIIRKERRTQLISAVLTMSGALGLAFRYRDVLIRRTSR